MNSQRRAAITLLIAGAFIAGVLSVAVASANRPLVKPCHGQSCQSPSPSIPPSPSPSPSPSTSIAPSPSSSTAPCSGGPVFTVPGTIDATGTTDVAAALNNWVATVPDNSTISFPAGSTYKMSQGIQFAQRHGLTFAGNGATIHGTGPGSDQLSSPFVVGHAYGGFWSEGNTSIAICNFTLTGSQPDPGVFHGGTEGQSGIEADGVAGLDIANVTVSAVWADGMKVGDAASDVTFHNSHVVTAGRNGISVISGTRITIRDSAFDRSGYVTFDVEPNTASEASDTLLFSNNTGGSWGQEFFALDGSHTGAAINNVTVTGTSLTGSSLKAVVDNGGTARNRNVTFTNNSTPVSAAGPVLLFAHIDTLRVTGNTQPLSSGVLVSAIDCTGAVLSPNP